MVVGEGVPGRDFKALDAHVPYALVMGEQGLAMLDGLALKACFPLAKLNEIHGSWFDHRNPVVTMELFGVTVGAGVAVG